MTEGHASARGEAFRPQRWVVEVPHTRDMGKEAAIFALKEAEELGPFVELALVAVLTDLPGKTPKDAAQAAWQAESRRVEDAVLQPFNRLASTKDVKSFCHVEIAEQHHQGLCDAVIRFSAARLYMNTRKQFSLIRRTSSAVQYLEDNLPRGVSVVVVKGTKKAHETLTSGERRSHSLRPQQSESALTMMRGAPLGAADVDWGRRSGAGSEGGSTPGSSTMERAQSLDGGSPGPSVHSVQSQQSSQLSQEPAEVERWQSSSLPVAGGTPVSRYRPSLVSSDFSDLSQESLRRSCPSDGGDADAGGSHHSGQAHALNNGEGAIAVYGSIQEPDGDVGASRHTIDLEDDGLIAYYDTPGTSLRYTDSSSTPGRSFRALGEKLGSLRRRGKEDGGGGVPPCPGKTVSSDAMPLQKALLSKDPLSQSERWGQDKPWESAAAGAEGGHYVARPSPPHPEGGRPPKMPAAGSRLSGAHHPRSRSTSGHSGNMIPLQPAASPNVPSAPVSTQPSPEASLLLPGADGADTAALLEEIARLRKSAEAAQAAAAAAGLEARRAREEAQTLMRQVSPGANQGDEQAAARARLLAKLAPGMAGAPLVPSTSLDKWQAEQAEVMGMEDPRMLTNVGHAQAQDPLLGVSKRTLKEELADELGSDDNDDPAQFLFTVASARAEELSSAFSVGDMGEYRSQSTLPPQSSSSGMGRMSGHSLTYSRSTVPEGFLESIVSVGSESVSSAVGGGSGECRYFSAEQLKSATDGFAKENLLGRGSYGPVYRGQLLGCAVAVKRLEGGGGQGGIEFQTEVDVLSRCRHPHIVLLMGHCPEEYSLVYEYLPGGSLQQRLHPELAPGSGGAAAGKPAKAPLAWPERFRIASEVASALLFLHRYDPPIIHRDLKPDNILLDGNDISKISDVGLARLVPEERYECSMRVMGTIGFIDPEMMRTGEISVKADLYAFGVILLLLITGIKQVKQLHAVIQDSDPGQGMERDKEAAVGILMRHLDSSAGTWPKDLTAGILTLAVQCIERDSDLRPSLESEVLPFLRELARRAREVKETRQHKADSKFICPLSKEKMKDPVVAADGFTYEREHIEKWLQTSDVSPSTGDSLAHKTLAPNKVLQELIEGSV